MDYMGASWGGLMGASWEPHGAPRPGPLDQPRRQDKLFPGLTGTLLLDAIFQRYSDTHTAGATTLQYFSKKNARLLFRHRLNNRSLCACVCYGMRVMARGPGLGPRDPGLRAQTPGP